MLSNPCVAGSPERAAYLFNAGAGVSQLSQGSGKQLGLLRARGGGCSGGGGAGDFIHYRAGQPTRRRAQPSWSAQHHLQKSSGNITYKQIHEENLQISHCIPLAHRG